MREFNTPVDSKYRKIEKLDMKLPTEIPAFKLIRKANISKEEKQASCEVKDKVLRDTECCHSNDFSQEGTDLLDKLMENHK